MRNSPLRWGWLAQLLHWLTALLIAVTIPIGWIANSLERGPLERALFDVHFHIGVTVLIVVGARLMWRLIDRRPDHSPSLRPNVIRAATLSHSVLYTLLLVMIASGYAIHIHMWPTLSFFGVEIPRPFDPGEDESIRAAAWYVHTWSWWVLLGVIAVHAGAALWHHFVRGDDVLRRMVPQIGRVSDAGERKEIKDGSIVASRSANDGVGGSF